MIRRIHMHVFCSIKGGVGKSTLTVACAKLLAAAGRVPVLIDADLSGTSLADGLLLRAPKVAVRGDGTLDLDAPPTGEHYTVPETWRLRDARKNTRWENHSPPPAYLNDALHYEGEQPGQECRVDAMLWAHEREDGVAYLPSSSLQRDVQHALGWIYNGEPFAWICRIAWILDALLDRLPQLTDIVVDLPPGVWQGGFSHELLALASMLSRGETLPEDYPPWTSTKIVWMVTPILVTTPDLNDLLPALEYVATHSAVLPTLRPLVNRAGSESQVDLRNRLRRRLDPGLIDLGVDEQLVRVDELARSLGKLFHSGDLPLNEEVRALSSSLDLKETP